MSAAAGDVVDGLAVERLDRLRHVPLIFGRPVAVLRDAERKNNAAVQVFGIGGGPRRARVGNRIRPWSPTMVG
jgi:hypothetical protein